MSDAPGTWYWDEHFNRSREGDTPVAVEWEGGSSEGVLFNIGVPRTVAGLLEMLPLKIPVIHVQWSGDMIMSTKSYDFGFTQKENEIRLPRVGDLSWDPVFGELAFTYGTVECRLPSGDNTVVVFGTLQTALTEFGVFCRSRRFEGQGEIELRLA